MQGFSERRHMAAPTGLADGLALSRYPDLASAPPACGRRLGAGIRPLTAYGSPAPARGDVLPRRDSARGSLPKTSLNRPERLRE